MVYFNKGDKRGLCACPLRWWLPLLFKTVLGIVTFTLALKTVLLMNAFGNFTENLNKRQVSPLVSAMAVQSERQNTLRSACDALNITIPVKHTVCSQTYVDHDRRFIYCRIFKVSSSSMKKALVNSTADATFTNNSKLDINDDRFLAKYGLISQCVPKITAVHPNISNYFKFILVRHPLKRLLSAYGDKFLGKHIDNINTFQKGIGTKIIKKYRKSPSVESLVKGHDVTFEEFLRYVIDTKDKPDGHWRSYWGSCRPCENTYDFIAKMETMEEDTAFILNKVARRQVPMPRNPTKLTAPGKTDDVFKDYYSKVSKDIMESIIKIFEKDFKVFGYDPFVYLN